jgi:hypothetical protein
VDIDAIMIAIRIATFGHDMPIGSRCPACGNEDEYTTDLRMVNETITAGDYHRTLKLGDLELYFRPLNYKQINANSLAQFEQQKMMANIESAADASQEIKSRTMSEALKNLTDVTMKNGSTTVIAKHLPLFATLCWIYANTAKFDLYTSNVTSVRTNMSNHSRWT